MDDNEYYSIMNRSSSFVIGQFLNQQKKKTTAKGSNNPKSFTKLEQYQGRDDAEMLFEKNENYKK